MLAQASATRGSPLSDPAPRQHACQSSSWKLASARASIELLLDLRFGPAHNLIAMLSRKRDEFQRDLP
jgi:hypothetical protein